MSIHAPVLETARLRLRGYARGDFEWFHELWLEEEVNRYTGQRTFTRADNWSRFMLNFGHWELMGHGYWMIEGREHERESRRLGICGVMHMPRGIPQLDAHPETGWVVAPAASGRGIATEAMRAVLGWVDAKLDAPQTGCIIEEPNAASIRVATKLGYQLLGPVPFNDEEILAWTRARGGVS